MRIKNSDLIAAISIAALNMLWTQIPDRPLLVGIIFALPLTFILPGYTLTQGLTSKRSADQTRDADSFMPLAGLKKGRPVDGTDQLVLSLGLSLAVDVLVGFALNVFPPGLQAQSWALSLGLFTTLFALLAVFLRRRHSVQVASTPRLRITIYDGILVGLVILVATTAIWSAIIRPLEPQSSFTQLWILPANQASKSCAVSIGVQSFELTPLSYQVVVLVNGTQIGSWSSIALAPRKEWVQSVQVIPGLSHSMSIEAQLYRVDKPDTVYRNVHLTFYIAAGSKNGPAQQQCTLRT
ncbi:MAG: DUF1616 domain-containing protein [Ktedonobacteraceae bacterium]